MRTELICVGTELLSGKLNTNVGYIGEKLNSLGILLDCTTTVPDETGTMEQVFREVFSRSDITIITGGLGPTFDDLTRDIAAKALDKKLILDREILQNIAQHFVKRGVEMPKENEKQAYIIEGAKAIPNALGTAPGQIIELKDNNKISAIFLLPGPPKEMIPMLDKAVIPYLKGKFEHVIMRSKVLHIYGLSESKADELIQPVLETERMMEKGRISFTILAHRQIIDIKTTVSGFNEIIVDEALNTIRREFYQILGDHIYGEDNQTLESVLSELLAKKRKTLAVAESCTGGLLSNRITNISGVSIYFKMGVVVYSNDSKINLLKVSADTIREYGAVSKETAMEMARGIKKVSGSDYGLSITGIAGPGGGTAEKPVGLVYFGLASDKGEFTEEKKFNGTRAEIKEFSANYALHLLYKTINRENQTAKQEQQDKKQLKMKF